MNIRPALKEDAPFLAKVVIEAIGPELCLGLAGSAQRLQLVQKLFSDLAERSDSQYSYKNTFVAVDNRHNPIGGIIAYDGERLHELRRTFATEAARTLGWISAPEEVDSWEDEADAGEIYIDSLYVVPGARKQGVAAALLKAVENKYQEFPIKPLGLLVEPDNQTAFTAYRHWGFKEVGISNFFKTPMIHMQKARD